MPTLEQGAMRPAPIFAGMALALALSAAPVHAQSRTFNCAQGPAITLTVINPTAIYADPIAQDVKQLKQVPADATRFSDGVYAVRISPDQTEITVEIPNAQPAWEKPGSEKQLAVTVDLERALGKMAPK